MTAELINVAKISYNITRANLYMLRFENSPVVQMDGKVSGAPLQHKIYLDLTQIKTPTEWYGGLEKKGNRYLQSC